MRVACLDEGVEFEESCWLGVGWVRVVEVALYAGWVEVGIVGFWFVFGDVGGVFFDDAWS